METLTHNFSENIQFWQSKFGLTYHVPYAFEAEKLVGLKNKHVLEVGGKLHRGFVFDALGVSSWTALEAPEYEPLADAKKNTYQIGHIEENSNTAIDNIATFELRDQSYQYFHCAVENMPVTMHGQFDVIFSIACFEHILNFDTALDAMYRALKPGGKLFSMFSPVWSSHNGHHLPPITDKVGKTYWHNQSPIPPWGHLTMRAPELFRYLTKHTDAEAAEKIVYHVYHSPAINRYYTDDFIRFFQNSNFTVRVCQPTFKSPLSIEGQKSLKHLHPTCNYFENNGLLVILEATNK